MLAMMKISEINGDSLYCYTWDFIDSKMYILVHENEALIIDPNDSSAGKEFLLSLNLDRITVILTHEHFDHISGVNWLREHFTCHVIANRACAENVIKPTRNLSNHADVLVNFNQRLASVANLREIEPFVCEVDEAFEQEMEQQWYHHKIRIVSTPGHSKGSVCILLDDKYVFTGDTYLPDYETILRLPGGSRREYETFTKQFIEEIIQGKDVYPGHGSYTVKNVLR